MRLSARVVRLLPRWVWPAFELVTASVVLAGAALAWWLLWSTARGVGVPVRALWPLLIALPLAAVVRVGRELRSLVTRWCNRRDALLDGWCSSDG